MSDEATQGIPTTEYIEPTATLLAQTATRLQTREGWTVEVYSGTTYQRLFERLPDLPKPSVVVVYSGSDYASQPRRTARITVLVVVEDPRLETGANTARELADAVIDLLDELVFNQAKWEVTGDQAVDVAPNVACIAVNFTVQDN